MLLLPRCVRILAKILQAYLLDGVDLALRHFTRIMTGATALRGKQLDKCLEPRLLLGLLRCFIHSTYYTFIVFLVIFLFLIIERHVLAIMNKFVEAWHNLPLSGEALFRFRLSWLCDQPYRW